MKKLRVGVIGCGRISVMHLVPANYLEEAELVWCCDIKEDRARAIAEKYGIKAYTDYIEMLDSGLVDAVLVETPHYFHPEMVMECLKRGIHAVCEKPAGVYTKQVREMNEAAAKSNALFGMMFNQRTNCLYRKMKEMIAQYAAK